MTAPLRPLGDPGAVVCEGDVCMIPGATTEKPSGAAELAGSAEPAGRTPGR